MKLNFSEDFESQLSEAQKQDLLQKFLLEEDKLEIEIITNKNISVKFKLEVARDFDEFLNRNSIKELIKHFKLTKMPEDDLKFVAEIILAIKSVKIFEKTIEDHDELFKLIIGKPPYILDTITEAYSKMHGLISKLFRGAALGNS